MKNIITIDGPAGSGKSTLAKELAEHLGFKYLNTGAMYRALTLLVLQKNIDPDNEDLCENIASKMAFEIQGKGISSILFINGKEVPTEIKTEIVDKNVSFVSKHVGVRSVMAQKQRDLGLKGNIVVEGRDAGTKIFPDAESKIFVTASIEERARRRYEEYKKKGVLGVNLEKTKDNMKKRDDIDSNRKHSPLTRAKNSIVIDTTDMTKEEQLNKTIEIISRKDIL